MGPIKLFISYSHKDEDLRKELVKHLTILKRQNVIELWHDRDIESGAEWNKEIEQHLNEAQIILLLISNDFIASDFCWDKEMERAMQRHKAGGAVVIPILLRSCDWSGAPFGNLQGLPKDMKPVKDWADRDQAFTNIARDIRKQVEKLTSKSVESTTKDKADAHDHEPILPRLSRLLRRKGIVIVGVLMLAAAVATTILIFGSSPTMDLARKVNYQDASPWTPSQLGWEVQSIAVPESNDSPAPKQTGHLIKGDQIGFLGKSVRNQFSLYQDFDSDLNVSLVNSKGVAWVVRAKDNNNFCLFELYPPKEARGEIAAGSASDAGEFIYSTGLTQAA
jgi:flagellar basal body-associated protein FliL